MSLEITNKENSVTQNEHQLKSKTEIVNKVIKIFIDNNLSITDAREILRAASKKLGNQKITSFYL